jgi:hypothetical protein
MLNSNARKQAKAEVITALTNAGLVQGNTFSNSEIAAETKTLFWHGVLRNETARNKGIYVTYEIVGSDANTNADNTALTREVTIAVDIFCTRSFDAEQPTVTAEKIEQAFTDSGFIVEVASEIYESDTKLFHLPMTVYKLF